LSAFNNGKIRIFTAYFVYFSVFTPANPISCEEQQILPISKIPKEFKNPHLLPKWGTIIDK